jgi:hypothetical protein
MKRRFLPTITESVVIALLLAALIYGAVSSANGTGACQPNVPEEEEEGDGDDAGQGTTNVDVASGNRACALTKASTGMTVSFYHVPYVLAYERPETLFPSLGLYTL